MTEGPVFLAGFMGVGKTQVGRILARELGRCFLDTDRMVEQRAGKTIAEIFADEGEAHFRQLERDCVLETCQRPDAVVALGGGADYSRRQRRGRALRWGLGVPQGRRGYDFCPNQSAL